MLTWVPLILKESNPVGTAEFAVANQLIDHPAFQWWVARVISKWNRIVAKVKSHYWKTSHDKQNTILLTMVQQQGATLTKECIPCNTIVKCGL